MMAAIFNYSTSTTEQNMTDFILNNTQKSETSNCMVLKFEGVVPWDNPDSLISAETEDFVHRVKYTVVLPILFLIGGPANVINMGVFYKQGLKERINVCLFSLSLFDLLNLLFNLIFYGEQMYLQLTNNFTVNERYGPLMRFMINHNLLGFYGFTWASQIISAIIASERCFCVLWPLRSQTALSTSTTTVIIVVSSVLMLGLYSLTVTRYRAMCAHEPQSNSDIWILSPSQFYFDHRRLVDSLDGYVFGVAIPVLVMMVVTVTTIVTMIKLRQAAAWRASTTSSSSLSAREMGTTVMLVYNSIFFVICVSPLAFFRMLWLFVPELQAGRRQHNLYFLFVWLLDIAAYVNHTFNFVVYYTMGSRYRQTFWQLMGRSSKTTS